MKGKREIVLAVLAMLLLTAAIEWSMGRLPLGPDRRFGLWESNIWSNAQSQRVADPYSFSHVGHGLLFYGLLWLAGRRLPLRLRFLIAVLLEAAWEVFENSPIVISRYREATIALGYEGDSILNSVCDVGMMALGFLMAARSRVGIAIGLFLTIETSMLILVRDNLTLNIVMLIHPIPAIKAWQMAGAPTP